MNKVSPTHRGQGNDGEGEPDLTEEQSLVSDGTEDGMKKKKNSTSPKRRILTNKTQGSKWQDITAGQTRV